jgi:hypothetical protein
VQILNAGGTLEVAFSPVTNATGYNIYRSVAADGRPGTAQLITTLDSAATSFIDDGSIAPAPGFLAASLDAGGTLAEGVFVYRVSSVVNGIESPAGYSSSITVEIGNNTVNLSWNEVPGATYNVYRTLAAATELTGDEVAYLIAADLTDTAWQDTGAVLPLDTTPAPDGIAPLPIGTIGRWQEDAEWLGVGREGPGAVIVAIEDTTRIYVAGGREDGGGENYLSSVEYAVVQADGSLGPWQDAVESLSSPRAFFTLVSSQAAGTSALAPEPIPAQEGDIVSLFAVAGDDSFTSTGFNDGLMTIEAAVIDLATGEPGVWTEQDADLAPGRTTYANGAVVVDEYLYCLPGVDQEQAGTDGGGIDYEPTPLGSLTTRFEVTLDPLSDPYVDILSGYQSSNGGYVVPRSYFGLAHVNSRVFLVGGNDGLGPIVSVETIPQ